MKVAYNNCYGGFGLSVKAKNEYAKRKGFNLTWYKQIKREHSHGENQYEKITLEEAMHEKRIFGCPSSTQDLGDVISEIPDELYYSIEYNEVRSDKDLIEIIEEMGEDANGLYADLQIKEIPDGSQYEITYYDGLEDVVPPRESW